LVEKRSGFILKLNNKKKMGIILILAILIVIIIVMVLMITWNSSTSTLNWEFYLPFLTGSDGGG
jgi:hypothetical protein